jgi:hypothetical protein
MTLSYLPAGRTAFVPRPCGFGARLLGLDLAAARTEPPDAIVAARQERDLLRPDLTLVGADGTLLPEALGCPVAPEEWDLLELGEPEGPLAAALAVVEALGREGAVGVVLTGPVTLAGLVAGAEDSDDDLIDICAMAVCDAAKAVLSAGGHVVLEEQRAIDSSQLALCSALLNLLAHHRRPALVLIHDDDGVGALGDPHAAIGAAVHGTALPDWGASWSAAGAQPVFAPRVAADASPERVQELIRELHDQVVA